MPTNVVSPPAADVDTFFQRGNLYFFHYPRHNFAGVRSKLEPRRVRVLTVRDLKENPLSDNAFRRQPLIKRCRWLITGYDIDKDAPRSFYVDSMRSVFVIG